MSANNGLATPLAATPVSDPNSVTFSNTWYLFWVAIGSKIISILRRIAILEAADQITDKTLTADTTIQPPPSGSRWKVIIRQNGTGGWLITWGASIIAATTGLDTTASTISTFDFAKSGSDWVMIGQPSTGMTS